MGNMLNDVDENTDDQFEIISKVNHKLFGDIQIL